MDLAGPNPIYYKLRTVQISPRDSSGGLPKAQLLDLLLPSFGTPLACHFLRIKDGNIILGKPNTAIVVFKAQDSVKKILESSRRDKAASFWRSKSIMAHTLTKKGPVADFFTTKILPELRSQSIPNGQTSGSKRPLEAAQTQPGHFVPEDSVPLAKRPRSETWGITSSDPIATSSYIASPIPDSLERMAARIAQLEAELDTAKAAASDQGMVRLAHQVAMIQKSALEGALSRGEIEKNQLRTELENVQSQNLALTNDVNALREQLATAEEKLRLGQLSSNEPENSSEQVKALEKELDDARDHAHKLQLENFRLQRQIDNPDTTELDAAKAEAKQFESGVERMRLDLASSQEQLESTQQSLASTERSLELMEAKYSSTRGQYKSTKAKLGEYKSRLKDEQAVVQKMKDTFTPEVYRLLGETYETIGAFLSITGLPPIDGEEDVGLKKEAN